MRVRVLVVLFAVSCLMGALSAELSAPQRTGDVGIGRLGGGQCQITIAEEQQWTDPSALATYGLEPRRGDRVIRVSCAAVAAAMTPLLTHASACLLNTWRTPQNPDPLAGVPCS